MSNIYGGRGLEITKGSGAEIIASDGKTYIDFLCGNGSALFGHCHPKLVETAKKALDLPWTVSPGLINASRDSLRSHLAALLPDGKVFLSNSGTEAIEAALKLALALQPKRKKILALRRSFHGRTMGSLSLTFNPLYKKAWTNYLLDVQHVKMEDMPQAIDDQTAFAIVEPIQGEGGVYPMPQQIAQAITQKCKETGTLLVADEIQSGYGRCGSILLSHQIGLDPHIITLAKGVAGGLPIGATLWKGAIGDFPSKGHGSTYGGNPVISSVGLAAFNLLQTENYPQQALEKGDLFVSMLKDLNSPLIDQIRNKGLLIGLELKTKADPIVKTLQDNGILALNAGPQVLRFLPPFVAQEKHFKTVTSKLKEILENTKNEDNQ